MRSLYLKQIFSCKIGNLARIKIQYVKLIFKKFGLVLVEEGYTRMVGKMFPIFRKWFCITFFGSIPDMYPEVCKSIMNDFRDKKMPPPPPRKLGDLSLR
jgi:hypothetical protein